MTPIRLFGGAVVGAALSFFGGCAGPSVNDSVETSGRAQRLAPPVNRFVGDWGPGAGYVANDWIVRFSRDGRVSVQGPGLIARGTYLASDRTANVTYEVRNGEKQKPSGLGEATFRISPAGDEINFETGLPNDPPVHLVRR